MSGIGETCPECGTHVMKTFMYQGRPHLIIEHACGSSFVYDLELLVANTNLLDGLPLAAAKQLANTPLGKT
jgi:hypothetical protein